ncbi:flagellar protein FliT [Cobetia marina]|jgi:hypothetical protein|uniref:flagellar protein FliT n=1 Tax=Cobetia marina TaxID=28258 RepID=UPI0026E25FFC|nr:flagellar protein FliT [Cobetia marina]MDO6786534.1 flagellar protein FliT [Cobetia marina]
MIMEIDAPSVDEASALCDALFTQMSNMLVAARAGDWPGVIQGQTRYIEQMQSLRMPDSGSAEAREYLERQLKGLTGMEAELTTLLNARKAQLQEVLGDVGTRRKLARSYGHRQHLS